MTQPLVRRYSLGNHELTESVEDHGERLPGCQVAAQLLAVQKPSLARSVQPNPAIMRPFRQFRTAGFSLVEMLVVISMIGIMALIGWPKMARLLNRSQVKAARSEVVNKFNQTRMQAVQTGRIMRFRVQGDAIWAERFGDGVVVGGVQDLNAKFGVTTSSTPSPISIAIDPRGVTFTSTTQIIRVGRFGARDSVVIVGYGGIQR